MAGASNRYVASTEISQMPVVLKHVHGMTMTASAALADAVHQAKQFGQPPALIIALEHAMATTKAARQLVIATHRARQGAIDHAMDMDRRRRRNENAAPSQASDT